jgi:hypothetical protein
VVKVVKVVKVVEVVKVVRVVRVVIVVTVVKGKNLQKERTVAMTFFVCIRCVNPPQIRFVLHPSVRSLFHSCYRRDHCSMCPPGDLVSQSQLLSHLIYYVCISVDISHRSSACAEILPRRRRICPVCRGPIEQLRRIFYAGGM